MVYVVDILSCRRQGLVVNTMAADGLATEGARASAAMVLTCFTRTILASAPEGLVFVFDLMLMKCLQFVGMHRYTLINSLRPSDIIWWQGSRSILAQVMACCLRAPSHYLNQCWLMISEVLWHSPDSNFTENAYKIYRWNELEIY